MQQAHRLIALEAIHGGRTPGSRGGVIGQGYELRLHRGAIFGRDAAPLCDHPAVDHDFVLEHRRRVPGNRDE